MVQSKDGLLSPQLCITFSKLSIQNLNQKLCLLILQALNNLTQIYTLLSEIS